MLSRDEIRLIRAMEANGVEQREIARRTGHSRDTIRKYIRSSGYPEPATFDRPSKLDPYKELVLEWIAGKGGELTGREVWERLKAEHGFAGSYQTVQRYLHDLGYGYGPRRRRPCPRRKPS